jgi:FixJ family two-component response regulator
VNSKRVYVADGDAAVVRGLVRMLGVLGYDVVSFDSADGFLAGVSDHAPACALLDAYLRPNGELDVLDELERRGTCVPVILMSGHADVESCVNAMKHGAVDYLLKPILMSVLETAIVAAHAISAARYSARQHVERAQMLLARLTTREREVLDLVLAGRRNKEIASALASQEATVKVHRSRLMHKLQVRSIPELVQLTSLGRNDAAEASNVVPLAPAMSRVQASAGRRQAAPRAETVRPAPDNAWAAAGGTWTRFTWPRQ